MKIYKTAQAIILESEGKKFVTEHTDWDSFVNRVNLFDFLKSEIPKLIYFCVCRVFQTNLL